VTQRLNAHDIRAANQVKWAAASPFPRKTVPQRADQNIAPEPGHIGNDHPRSPTRHRVPQHQLGAGCGGIHPYPVGVVSDQLVERRAGDLGCHLSGVIEPDRHPGRDLVTGAPGYGIVELTLQQQTPAMTQD
jgi:hypothetical protein